MKSKFLDPDHCYIIAELSANHNGKLENALELVQVAADSGADAVKIQTYTADTMTLDSDQEYFKIKGGTLWDGRKLYDLYEEAHTPWEWHEPIFNKAKELGLDFLSTPFDDTAVDYLEQFNPICHKIASFELTHHPLLKKVAQTGRPVILSTGMASLEEIEAAVEVLKTNGCEEIILLKCTSSYPAPAKEANLARMADMSERFGVTVGLSDHTLGLAVPIAAVALGAKVIEKHFCLSRDLPGPDSAFSLEPHEFKQMVDTVRVAQESVGEVTYELTSKEVNSRIFRRSIFISEDVKSGDVLTEQNTKIVRPNIGLGPEHISDVLGKKVNKDASKGSPVEWDLID